MKTFNLLNRFQKNKYNGHEPVSDINVLNEEVTGPTDSKVPCVIYRNSDRHRVYRDVATSLIPEDSIPWHYKGEYRHFLGLLKNNTIYTIKPEDAQSDNDTPQSLMVILSKLRILVIKSFPLGKDVSRIVKYGLLIAFSFCELIALFFLVTIISGGTKLP